MINTAQFAQLTLVWKSNMHKAENHSLTQLNLRYFIVY